MPHGDEYCEQKKDCTGSRQRNIRAQNIRSNPALYVYLCAPAAEHVKNREAHDGGEAGDESTAQPLWRDETARVRRVGQQRKGHLGSDPFGRWRAPDKLGLGFVTRAIVNKSAAMAPVSPLLRSIKSCACCGVAPGT